MHKDNTHAANNKTRNTLNFLLDCCNSLIYIIFHTYFNTFEYFILFGTFKIWVTISFHEIVRFSVRTIYLASSLFCFLTQKFFKYIYHPKISMRIILIVFILQMLAVNNLLSCFHVQNAHEVDYH